VVNTLARLGARAYWRANMPFVAAFAESLLGYGEGAYAVDGKAIAARLDGFLAEVNTPVFLQFVATLALLPLYEPPKWPRSNLAHSVVKVWYFFKSLFAHGQFLAASKEKRAAWIEEMYQRLIRDAPEQEDDTVKTITTLNIFKFTLVSAYLDDARLWSAIDYVPFPKGEWNPPSGPNLETPPRTTSSQLLHEHRQTPPQVAVKPPKRLTYCVIGSGAGGAIAARTIQEENPDARVILIEEGPLVTNDQFKASVLDSLAKLYMNAAITLSKDQQFMFQQGRCVGGSTVVNNSVAFRPEGFWWTDLKRRWQNLGIKLDFDDLDRDFDVLTRRLHIAPVQERVISAGARTVRDGFARLVAAGRGADTAYADVLAPITVSSNSLNCVGCGRCNLGCQYDAKQSTLVAVIPDFVRAGGLLVPDAKAVKLEFGPDDPQRSGMQVKAVCVLHAGGTTRIEAVHEAALAQRIPRGHPRRPDRRQAFQRERRHSGRGPLPGAPGLLHRAASGVRGRGPRRADDHRDGICPPRARGPGPPRVGSGIPAPASPHYPHDDGDAGVRHARLRRNQARPARGQRLRDRLQAD